MTDYTSIIQHYESCFEKHGDTHLGVDWPKAEDATLRYEIMLDLISYNHDKSDCTLLDFGCGTAHLLEYIHKNNLNQISYHGLDLSQKFVDACKAKFPKEPFYCADLLKHDFKEGPFDYIIMNGVFTEKRSLTHEQMWNYFTQLIEKVYALTNKGIAFNVMSKNVDWERNDLFHVSLDILTAYLCKNLTRQFIIRNDYGLYEYTVYIYKK